MAPKKAARKPNCQKPKPDNTDAQNAIEKHHFKPGAEWKGNALGRPKGSRNKINEHFLRDLQALWEAHGRSILMQTALNKPEVIVKAMLTLLPKQVELTAPLDEMSDEQLAIIADELLAKYGRPGAEAAPTSCS